MGASLVLAVVGGAGVGEGKEDADGRDHPEPQEAVGRAREELGHQNKGVGRLAANAAEHETGVGPHGEGLAGGGRVSQDTLLSPLAIGVLAKHYYSYCASGTTIDTVVLRTAQ